MDVAEKSAVTKTRKNEITKRRMHEISCCDCRADHEIGESGCLIHPIFCPRMRLHEQWWHDPRSGRVTVAGQSTMAARSCVRSVDCYRNERLDPEMVA